MSTLAIDYNKLDSVSTTAISLSKKLQNRIDDLNGIRKRTRNISESKYGNISNANYFIQKKEQQYEDKKDKLTSFANKVNSFKEEVKSADLRVANRINVSTKNFTKANGISICPVVSLGVKLKNLFETDIERFINSEIKKNLSNTWCSIKDWYHYDGGKYIVNIFKDLVFLGISIAICVVFPPATILAAFFAGFAIYNCVSDIIFDVGAYSNFKKTNDRLKSDKIDQKGGREMTQFLGKTTVSSSIPGFVLRNIIGEENYSKGIDKLTGDVYDTVFNASAVYAFANLLKSGSNITTIKNNIKNGSGIKNAFNGTKYLTTLDDINPNSIAKLESSLSKINPKFSEIASKTVQNVAVGYKNVNSVINVKKAVNGDGIEFAPWSKIKAFYKVSMENKGYFGMLDLGIKIARRENSYA